jgi:hypothetical protein
MNETTKLSTFLKKLRAAIPGAVIFKHADKATRDIPDVSITWRKRTTWLEAKLVLVSDSFSLSVCWENQIPCLKIAEESKTQFFTAYSLAVDGHCWYLFFIKKSKGCLLWHPVTKVKIPFNNQDDLVAYLRNNILNENPLNVLT